MYISKFRIQNFKGFEDITFHFHEKVNILTGVNNSGKTSVLEALALWQECYALLLQQAGKTVANRYRKGQYILQERFYTPYTDIISIKSPRYEDIFKNLDVKKNISLIVTLSDGAKTLEIYIYIAKQEGLMNYKIGLANYQQNFDFQLFNDNSFIENPATAIKTIFSIPVGTLVPQEEIKRWQAINRYVVSRNSREVLRNRLRDLKNRFEDNYAKLLGNLQTILVGSPNSANLTLIDDKDVWVEADIILPNQISINLALMGSGTIQIIELLLSIHEQANELNLVLLDEPDTHLHRQLQKKLLSAIAREKDTQVFITTHNEALIRDANANWVFHLENQAKREEPYQAIAANLPTKKGLLQSGKSPIISALNGGNGLDFVNALEADILFLVEGEDDALRMQQLLSLRNTNKKFAFWILRGVDSIFSQIGLLKDVFINIKNNKTLWQKAVLLFDKDLMTDVHRQLLMEGFEGKMGIKTHIWQSYCFESVLFSNMSTLLRLLQRFIKSKHSLDANTADLNQYFETALIAQINAKEERIKAGSLFNTEVGKFQSRRKKLIDKDLKMELKDIIEQDAHLQRTLETYWQNCCTFDRFHEIMNKKDIETVLNTVLQHFNIDFVLDEDNGRNDFDDLFACIDIITEPNEYNVFSTFIR